MYNIKSSIIINNNKKLTIIFLHGWGCNKNYFLSIAKKIDFANVAIPDLPGFGNNDALSFPFTLKDYVNSILLFIEKNKINPNIIVGHSFGGKLSVLLSRKLKINYLILLSPSILHKKRHIDYYIKVFAYKLLKKLKIFGEITKKMGSTDYKILNNVMKKTMSNVINEKNINEYKKINTPILLIFGESDKITPKELGKKLKKMNKNAALITLEGDHFFYLKNETTIIFIIKELIKLLIISFLFF